MKASLLFRTLPVVLLLTACQTTPQFISGGQTGGEVRGEVPDVVTTSACRDTQRQGVSLEEEQLEAGFSAAQAADTYTLDVTAPLTWQAAGGITVAPQDSGISLRLELVVTALPATQVFREPNAAGAQPTPELRPPAPQVSTAPDFPPLVSCSPRLELGAQGRLSSSGGELDEAFTTTLNVLSLEAAALELSFDVTQLNGVLKITSVAADASLGPLAARLTLRPALLQGQLTGSLTLESPASNSNGNTSSAAITLIAQIK